MNRKETISLEDRKKIQLEMLDEIHVFCRRNNIKYSLAFGTLLGAVRHKGFIPWDDDVDIMMPLPDLLKFKELFNSAKIQYHDVYNDKFHQFAFSLLSYKSTYRLQGLVYKGAGVCIDLYVCIGIPDDNESFFSGLVPLFNKRISAMNFRSVVINLLPIKSIPFFSFLQKKYHDYLFKQSVQYYKANYYYMIAGPLKLRKKMTYDYDIFDNIIETQFEGHQYCITSHYDSFLSLRYGDYMKMPPVEDRKPSHGEAKYYWGMSD